MTTGFAFLVSINNHPWQEIPEQIFYDSLYAHVRKVTPYIKEMLGGKEIRFGNTIYKIHALEIQKGVEND